MLHTPTRRRRIINTGLLLFACVVSAFVFRALDAGLVNVAEYSGWLLVFLVVMLLLYALRKRLSTLPIGRVAIWLQSHLYVGVFCLFVFAWHLQWQLPSGAFETFLAVVMAGTIVTGILGIYWARTIPPRLTRIGDEVMYDRIGGFAENVRREAEQTVLESVEATGSRALADFYARNATDFFAAPSFQWQRLYRNFNPSQRIQRNLGLARRFMRSDEISFADQLVGLIQQKARLDAHYTWQGVLKHWLFVHLAFSLSLIPLICLHIVLAYGFALA